MLCCALQCGAAAGEIPPLCPLRPCPGPCRAVLPNVVRGGSGCQGKAACCSTPRGAPQCPAPGRPFGRPEQAPVDLSTPTNPAWPRRPCAPTAPPPRPQRQDLQFALVEESKAANGTKAYAIKAASQTITNLAPNQPTHIKAGGGRVAGAEWAGAVVPRWTRLQDSTLSCP